MSKKSPQKPAKITAKRGDSTKTSAKPTPTSLALLRTFDPRFLIVWALIYFAFLLLDILVPGTPGSSLIKYAGIFICLVYAYEKSKHDHLLTLALLMTFLADTILIWTHQFVLGIFVFCFAQFFHLTRFTKTAPRFLIFYYLIIVSIFAFALIEGIPPIYAIAFVYAMSLLANLLLSIRWYRSDRQNPQALAACLGFILFALCDTHVGIQFLSGEGVFAAFLYGVATYLVWLFYFPSQILIANSSTVSKTPLHLP